MTRMRICSDQQRTWLEAQTASHQASLDSHKTGWPQTTLKLKSASLQVRIFDSELETYKIDPTQTTHSTVQAIIRMQIFRELTHRREIEQLSAQNKDRLQEPCTRNVRQPLHTQWLIIHPTKFVTSPPMSTQMLFINQYMTVKRATQCWRNNSDHRHEIIIVEQCD